MVFHTKVVYAMHRVVLLKTFPVNAIRQTISEELLITKIPMRLIYNNTTELFLVIWVGGGNYTHSIKV